MAPRKSAKAKKVVDNDQDSDYDEEGGGTKRGASSGDEFEAPKPKKKVAKTSAGKKGKAGGGGGRGKKNKLEVFNTMPLDVLREILEHLDPKTLLAMSRTCSTFRQTLHAPGAQSIWKQARQNVGLGGLKRVGIDVQEYEVAQLLHDGTCVGCGKKRAIVVDYVLFCRGCASCMRSYSLRREFHNENEYHEKAFDCVPRSHWMDYTYYWVPMMERVTRQLNALGTDQAKIDAFVESRKDIQKLAHADKRILEDWVEDQKYAARDAKENKRETRLETIKEKLRLEGYDEKDLQSQALSVHPDAIKAQVMSENVWKKIKPVLTSLLDEERTKRLEREALQRQRARAFALKPFYSQIENSLPPSSSSDLRTYFPPFSNFVSLSSVKPLYVPEGLVPTAEDLTNAKPAILKSLQAFANQLMTAFTTNLIAAYTALDPTFDPTTLSLTACTSSVKCIGNCHTYGTFPAILEHIRLCTDLAVTAKSPGTTPLQIKTIREIIAAVNAVEEGKLSESSSVTELYALGDTFECETCELQKNQHGQVLGVATWSTAYKTKEINWVVLLNHVNAKHEQAPCSIKYTRPPPPAPANPDSLVKDEDEEEETKEGFVEKQESGEPVKKEEGEDTKGGFIA